VTSTGSCSFEHEDGAYVLGALAPEDRAAFERHLASCDSCTRAVRDLAGLPGLLARVPVETLDPGHTPEPVPATLLPALRNRVQRERRRRSWTTAGLVAAAAAVAGIVVGVTVDNADHHPGTGQSSVRSAAARPFTPVGAVPISGWVSLTKVGWGTRLDLTCSYAESDGYRATGPVSYTMFVTRTDGTTEQVASWRAVPGTTMRLSGATSAAPRDITRVVVRTADGRDVLRLRTG
jgi:hypothetical protein